MRESIGTSFLLNFITVFIVFVFAFLAATLSYYKSYRINNAIIHALEKFEGYNQLSYDEIKMKLNSLGYQRGDIKCPKTRFLKGSSDKGKDGYLISDDKDGYCIYLYFDENPKPSVTSGQNATTDIYYSLGATTYLQMRIPVIGSIIRLPIFSKTYNNYYFKVKNLVKTDDVVAAIKSKKSSFETNSKIK